MPKFANQHLTKTSLWLTQSKTVNETQQGSLALPLEALIALQTIFQLCSNGSHLFACFGNKATPLGSRTAEASAKIRLAETDRFGPNFPRILWWLIPSGEVVGDFLASWTHSRKH